MRRRRRKTTIEDRGWRMARGRLRHPQSSILNPRLQLTFHPSEGAAAAAATATAPATTSLAALLTRHVLRDGELVLLLLKPSIWFILLSALRTYTLIVTLMIAALVFDKQLP